MRVFHRNLANIFLHVSPLSKRFGAFGHIIYSVDSSTATDDVIAHSESNKLANEFCTSCRSYDIRIEPFDLDGAEQQLELRESESDAICSTLDWKL